MESDSRFENLKTLFPCPLIQSTNDFESNLFDKLDCYQEFFHSELKYEIAEEDHESISSGIEKLNTTIKRSIKASFNGYLGDSHFEFNIGLKSLLEAVKLDTDYIWQFQGGLFFRLSNFDPTTDKLYKHRIFHCPFEYRTKVKSQRFSIPGFPTLYLGEDILVCAKELDFEISKSNEFIGSVFYNTEPLKIMKLLRIEDFLTRKSCDLGSPRSTNSFFLLFPLLIGSSFKVFNPKSDFKPEYIIPQLLMSFIRKHNDFDGIMYPSTRIDYSKIKGDHPYNYAFPVKESKSKGYCESLEKKFEWTFPETLDKISTRKRSFPPKSLIDTIERKKFEFDGISGFLPYRRSIFSDLEIGLFTKKFSDNHEEVLRDLRKCFP